MRTLVVFWCTSLAIGCASSGQRAEAPRSKVERVAKPDLATLTASVRAVALDANPASHDSLAAALHRLGEHLRALPAAPEAARVGAAADRLAASPANAHAELVVRALRSAQQGLETQIQEADPGAVASMAALATALEALASDRPLASQHSTVLAALEAATNTLALLRQQPPPFPESNPTWTPRPPAVALASARELTLEVARADLGKAAPIIARLVDDFASLLVGYGPSNEDEVTRLRFHAQRLAGQRPGIREEARWIREALTTALDGLEAGSSVRATDARAAVDNISKARSLVFQRARVQDAVRATLNAFIAAEPGSSTTTARSP